MGGTRTNEGSNGMPMAQTPATHHEARVLAAVLRRMLRGEPVSSATVGMATGLAPEEVEAALAALDAAGTIYRRDGRVAAAYPLSGSPTRHRLAVGHATAYANCAFDALAVPFMVDDPIEIESACALCEGPIALRMSGGRVLSAQPEAPVVYGVSEACCEPGPAVLTRCPYITFFCGAGHAAAWQRAHPERTGTIASLADAVVRAGERFAAVARLVRGGEVSLAELSLRTSGP